MYKKNSSHWDSPCASAVSISDNSSHARDCGCREIFCLRNPEFGKVFLVETGNLGFKIRNTAQRIRNVINGRESRFHWQRLKSCTMNRNPRREIQNPRLYLYSLTGCEITNQRLLFTHGDLIWFVSVTKHQAAPRRSWNWIISYQIGFRATLWCEMNGCSCYTE